MSDNLAGVLLSPVIVAGWAWSEYLGYRQRRTTAELESQRGQSSAGAGG